MRQLSSGSFNRWTRILALSMLGAQSLITPLPPSQATPLRLAPATPPSDLLVQFFQRANKKHSESCAASTVPTKASLDRVMEYESPNISDVHDGSMGHLASPPQD